MVETVLLPLTEKKSSRSIFANGLVLFLCFADTEVAFFSEVKSSYKFAGNATACSKHKLYKDG